MRHIPEDPSELTPDGRYLAVSTADLLLSAHPVTCPPSQLGAIEEDVFPTFADAADYAKAAKLPFESLFLDFSPGAGQSYPVVEFGGKPLVGQTDQGTSSVFQLVGVLLGHTVGGTGRIYLPMFLDPDVRLPMPLGCSVFRENDEDPVGTPGRIVEEEEGAGGWTAFNGAMIQASMKEETRPAVGSYMGIGEATSDDPGKASKAAIQAAVSAAAFRMSLKVLFLLDSVNIELADEDLPRQAKRRATRKGTAIASKIQIRQGKTRKPVASDNPDPARFEHQFEVRGNFAHYGPDTYLYKHSDETQITLCPRCGSCRRVWRPPHIKGPADKPLVVKVRQIQSSLLP